MNDPNKTINVNLSSLLSLKAELLRKQAEVNKAKAIRNVENFVPSKMSSSTSVDKKDKKDQFVEGQKVKNMKVDEHEDSLLLEKSQKVLEAKEKFYDRMISTGGQLNSDDNCLVLFNRKKQEQPPHQMQNCSLISSSDSSGDSSDNEEDVAHSDGEDWVEYTDCLGRTRKCLGSELDFIKKKDSELAASMPERLDQSAPNWMIDTTRMSDNTVPPPESIFSGGCSMMSKHDEMRNNWEKKEEENLNKTDVHYQDVFFDEARQHGVGYYAFSTDEEKRARQQKELEETRKRTLAEQSEREAQRALREKIIAERVRAAKNRQRARLGLPPLDLVDDEQKKTNDDAEKTPQTKEERKLKKREEKLKRKLERQEQIREEDRKNHVRPWDEEKEGLKSQTKKPPFVNSDEDDKEWQYRPERTPMSQEQWNEYKRAERRQEFAPVPEKVARKHFESMPPPAVPPPIVPPPPMTVPPPSIHCNPFKDASNSFVSFQSSKSTFQRRNYIPESHMQPTEDYITHRDRIGAAIPPPADLDATSSFSHFKQRQANNDDLAKSIEAGLKYLRNNSDKGTLSTKSTWTAKADY